MIAIVTVVLVGYIAGAIPFSYIAGKVFAGIDLREHGSGNLGASNTFRFLGPKVAFGVLILDMMKGFLPVYFAPAYAPGAGVSDLWLMIAAGAATVIGHMFSVFVRFQGGKGIATTGGAFLALAPWVLFGAFFVWALFFIPRRIVSLGSIAAAVALPVLVFLAGRVGLASSHWSLFAVSLFIAVVVLVKHRSNIKRLIAGQEPALHRRNG